MPPSILQAYLKRLQGVMLISVFQGPFNGASAFLWHCNTNCKLHSDEGRGRLPSLLSKAVCRSFASFPAVRSGTLQRVRFFLRSLLLFLRGCAFALSRRLRLFSCRLRGFFCFCNTLHAVRTFARLVACIAAAFVAASFVRPPCGYSTPQRGKDGWQQGNKPPASVGAFYSFRKPSASRCSFSATR